MSRRTACFHLCLALSAAMVLLAGGGASASAAAPGTAWRVQALTKPTNFKPNDQFQRYFLLVTNVGSRASEGLVTVTDKLPAGITLAGTPEITGSEGWTCTEILGATEVTCTTESALAGQEPATVITLPVRLGTGVSGSLTDTAAVQGGGAPSGAETSVITTVDQPTPFGIDAFEFGAFDAAGDVDTQAGDHAAAVVVNFGFSQVDNYEGINQGNVVTITPESLKSLAIDLPAGVIGNPTAVAKCQVKSLVLFQEESLCPASSQVGNIRYSNESSYVGTPIPIYNMVPEKGFPAVFGFNLLGHGVLMYATVGPAPGYGLRITVPGIPQVGFQGASVVFFGNPAERNGGGLGSAAFFTNPARCSAEPLTAKLSVESWPKPNQPVSKEATTFPQIGGCEALNFQPQIEVKPETTTTDTPTGYEVDLTVPQKTNLAPNLATPELKGATVALPPGVAVSPGAADGLVGCAETGPNGLNREGPEAVERGEGEADGSPYDDQQEHSAPGKCPQASKIGTVEIVTPLLESPLEGNVYLAVPKCARAACTNADAQDGNLFGLYLEAQGSGVVIKLQGSVAANPVTGQLTATFRENPQLPFSELKLLFKGGGRAPLVNPTNCGVYTAATDLSPWSAPFTPDATPSSSFAIDGNCGARGFAPSFTAGTTSSQANGFSAFTATIARSDGDQELSAIQVRMPPGLLGMLARVPLCGEAQANAGTCPAASQIGHTTVAAGAGTNPLYLPAAGQSQDPVYLTGSTPPAEGSNQPDAPFGLSIVVPAIAGPFNLGTVVVRAAITVDPHTAQATITSDSGVGGIPSILDGVPLQLRTVNVTIDRPGFIFNPTNCTPQTVGATITSTQGVKAAVSTPFAATNCATLPFKPKLTATVAARASKRGGAGLDVKLVEGIAGEANVRAVKVNLPKQLPSRLTTLQGACTEAQFNANPAGCPAASNVGTGTALTPVLNVPLTGPAYLVSHGGAAFPDLVVVLQGQGVTIDLTGNTVIKAGVTSSIFRTVPDAPVTSFELKLPAGPHSILGTNLPAKAHYSLCGQTLAMPTAITAQNGAVLKQSTSVGVTGCPRTRTRPRVVRAKKHAKRRRIRAG